MDFAPSSDTHLNDGYIYRERIRPGELLQTVLDYLSRRYAHSTRAQWEAHIAGGRVWLNTQPAHPHHLLHPGSELTWQRPPWVEPEAPKCFSVVYEDDDVLAVGKPAGLPTLPGANYLQSTLLYLVQRYAPDATPVHRLGRWTSGLLLCARNPLARTALAQQWSTHAIGKRYRALASGIPPWDGLTLTTPIGPVPHPRLGSLHAATPKGKPSLSQVTVLERRQDAFLCDVRITTGRPHQIRIHLAAAGHPLLGDPLYLAGGFPAVDSQALPGDPGYNLHATELRFKHPRSGKVMVLECEPPSVLCYTTDVR